MENYQTTGNITLIGMAGAGKSTVGPSLADYLDMHYLDTDFLLYIQEDMPVADIVQKRGADYFKKKESKIIISLNPSNTVISTGGSVVLVDDVMEHLIGISTLVYLHADYETIEERLGRSHIRKILFDGASTLKDVYDNRLDLYKRYADITVDASADVSSIIDEIFEGLKNTQCMN